MALSAKLCHVLGDIAAEMKCYLSKLQYSCHGNYKMGNHRCNLFHCHMTYGEILAPWVVEGDDKCGVYPKWLRGFCAGSAEEQQPQQILTVWILGAQLRDTVLASRQNDSLKNLRT